MTEVRGSATALSTDLYELTMMAGYYAAGETGSATFDLYVRDLPPQRGFLVAAGLDQALAYLESLRFDPAEIRYLRGLPQLKAVPADFFDRYLAGFRFTGEVWALEEGCPVFATEPILRVTAPLPEAQLVETALLATLMFQTTIASKAARVVAAAAGRPVVEYGSRRAHGVEAGLYAARAAYLGGCVGTSHVGAGHRFGIPVSGTMAHSWVMTFSEEMEAFRRYTDLFGSHATLLIDTYDTVEAARRIAASGLRPAAVRLDSGDLGALSVVVRTILDEAGLRETRILASGDLDEWRIADLLGGGAPIDGFGVGTALSTSSDAPTLSGVYKLAEVDRDGGRRPVMKLSEGKLTYPGTKQVWRLHGGEAGRPLGFPQRPHDVIALADESGPPGGVPLLRRVMTGGRREAPTASMEQLRARACALVAGLPAAVRRLDAPEPIEVRPSAALAGLTDRLTRRLTSDCRPA